MLTCFLKKPGTAGFFRGRSRLQYMGQHGIKNLLSPYASVSKYTSSIRGRVNRGQISSSLLRNISFAYQQIYDPCEQCNCSHGSCAEGEFSGNETADLIGDQAST